MWAPRVILGREEAAAAVHINAEGRIAAAWPCTKDEATAYAQVRSLAIEVYGDDEVISPGLVDAAAHLAEWLEGGSRSYEGFSSGTQAAAAGGITTVVDLPAHARPLTTTVAALQRKVDATRGRLHVDVGFWGAALPENMEVEKLKSLLAHGALGLTAVVAASPAVEQPGVAPGTRALRLPELETAIEAGAWPSCTHAHAHARAARAGLPCECIRRPSSLSTHSPVLDARRPPTRAYRPLR